MAAHAEAAPQFEIAEFLERERAKDLLRFTTAGSVDDGKSTLIGRLLYDSQNVYEDQIHAIRRGAGAMDLALLTDGLRAEREQGITIDVAYRYFATARRKFIIADTPGHEQYTRNMATGASTADLAIILIDARNGVQIQSRRHAYIAALLGIRHFVIAVNKMDLVGYREDVFAAIRDEFAQVLAKLGVRDAYFIPISALAGDNVVRRSRAMPWFDGPSLLEHLETVKLDGAAQDQAFRMAVQRVIRPDQSFRGYAGQIASGSVRPGDLVVALPSGRRTRVKSIETFDGPREEAFAPMSITLTLEDEIDLSRGDLLAGLFPDGREAAWKGGCGQDCPPHGASAIEANVVWLNERALELNRPYLLKHGVLTLPARVTAVASRVDMRTLEEQAGGTLELNGVGMVRIEIGRPIFFDPYRENRITGSAILIDPSTNATAGAVMIARSVDHASDTGPVSAAERAARFGHAGAVVRAGGRQRVAEILERRLFDRGGLPVIVTEWNESIADVLRDAGAVAIVAAEESSAIALPANDEDAAEALIEWLKRQGVLKSTRGLGPGEGI